MYFHENYHSKTFCNYPMHVLSGFAFTVPLKDLLVEDQAVYSVSPHWVPWMFIGIYGWFFHKNEYGNSMRSVKQRNLSNCLVGGEGRGQVFTLLLVSGTLLLWMDLINLLLLRMWCLLWF